MGAVTCSPPPPRSNSTYHCIFYEIFIKDFFLSENLNYQWKVLKNNVQPPRVDNPNCMCMGGVEGGGRWHFVLRKISCQAIVQSTQNRQISEKVDDLFLLLIINFFMIFNKKYYLLQLQSFRFLSSSTSPSFPIWESVTLVYIST